MGRVKIVSKNGTEMCPIVLTKKNEQGRREDRPFMGTYWRTRGWRIPTSGQNIHCG